MPDQSWWREGVLYQVYPRSFADANGDGIGDLRGIIGRLDYLQWLGVDGIWLNPIMPSPDKDWGYDVSDYTAVQPVLGDLAALDDLVAAAGKRNIRVILDLVPNHSSDQHPWFADSRSSRTSVHRDWYVWADGRPGGVYPNNWVSAFGGPAWTFDETTAQFYLNHFLPEQPDLNWWNPQVRDAFDDILRFWFDRGVAGFRIDVVQGIVKDRQLRDNPPVRPGDAPVSYDANLPEVHEVLRRWRSLADSYSPPRILVGETFVPDIAHLVSYYGRDDQLHLPFNFAFLEARFQAEALRPIVELTERVLPATAWPVYTASNHDVSRFPTRWCEGDQQKVRCALLILLALRGTPFLYYGDEIGMPDTRIARSDTQDWAAVRRGRSRDRARTPMPWSLEPGAGFTTPAARPWLPLGDLRAINVADQRRDPSSVLSFTHDLIAFRRTSEDLRQGGYRTIPSPKGSWVWRRGRATTVAVNLSDADLRLDGMTGTIRVHTTRHREGERVDGRVSLRPWQGVIVA